jgi:hypothetical protein
MKKMSLMLAACMFMISLNAQLMSVSTSVKPNLKANVSTDLNITKMERPQSQLSRINLGETLTQIAVMKQKKTITLSVLNVNPQIKFSIEDEVGTTLLVENVKGNIVKIFNVKKLPKGVYAISMSGSGITAKRFFTVTNEEIYLHDDLGTVTQTYK